MLSFKLKNITLYFLILCVFFLNIKTLIAQAPPTKQLQLIKTIYGNISPKSVVHSGNGLFFAQNMMYRHTVAVYNRNFELVKTISDKILPEYYGLSCSPKTLLGAPVEAAFTPNAQHAWISNYHMTGEGFDNPGTDNCRIGRNYHDSSFVYKINTQTFKIEEVVEAGSVPKYVAVSPNAEKVLVSNWCSGDIIIFDANTAQEIKRIAVGRYPRGIAIDSHSEFAYIALMGDSKIVKINLQTFEKQYIKDVGLAVRHLCISPTNDYLYASLNNEHRIAKIDLATNKVQAKVSTGKAPRSMVLTPNGNFLYTVNYESNTISKIDTRTFEVVETVPTNHHPIGITFDNLTNNVWVACYSGSLMVFNDTSLPPSSPPPLMLSLSLLEELKTNKNSNWYALANRTPSLWAKKENARTTPQKPNLALNTPTKSPKTKPSLMLSATEPIQAKIEPTPPVITTIPLPTSTNITTATPAKVAVPKPAPNAPLPTEPAPSQYEDITQPTPGSYVIVASLRSYEQAQQEVQKWKKRGFDPIILKGDKKLKNYRVSIAKLGKRKEAQQEAEKIMKAFADAQSTWVVDIH